MEALQRHLPTRLGPGFGSNGLAALRRGCNGNRLCLRRRSRGTRQIQHTVFAAGDHQRGRMHLQRRQHQALLQGTQLLDDGLHRGYGQQFATGLVMELDAGQLEGTGDHQLAGGGLLKRNFERTVQHRRIEPHRQAGRQIRQIGCNVQMGDLQRGLALADLRKRRDLGSRVKGAAIELERQMRLHRDIALRLQAAQKGQRHIQFAQAVPALSTRHMVDKIDRAVLEHQVVERIAGRRRGWCIGCRGKALQQVVDVVMPVARMGERQLRLLQGDGIQHRRQAPQ